MNQCCGTVMVYFGSGFGSDLGKDFVPVLVPDADNI
jgi:hypothetical protein